VNDNQIIRIDGGIIKNQITRQKSFHLNRLASFAATVASAISNNVSLALNRAVRQRTTAT
jgi:hypothetical protein